MTEIPGGISGIYQVVTDILVVTDIPRGTGGVLAILGGTGDDRDTRRYWR